MRATKYLSGYQKGILATAVIICTATFVAINVSAQTVYTEPVGFMQMPLLTNSDTWISMPFTQIPAYQGVVASVAGNVPGECEMTISNNPNFSGGEWSTTSANGFYTYYAHLTSGANAGATYTITNNGSATISLSGPLSLAGVAAGDFVRIVPFWTLNTVFPNGTGVVVSTSTSTTQRKTAVLFPDLTDFGVNLSPNTAYYFYNTAWRRYLPTTPVSQNWGDAVILPDQYIIVRQNSSVTITTTTAPPGQVVLANFLIPLNANSPASGTNQDNAVAIARPSIMSLAQSGLLSAFQASSNTSATARKDQLYIFDNTAFGQNKSAPQQFYYYNNGWRRSLPVTPVAVDWSQSNIFLPGTGAIVRKVTNSLAQAAWVNTANYTN